MRRKTLVSASATALCSLGLGALAAFATGCGGSHREGYVATGAAGPGAPRPAGETVRPTGAVEYVPLEGPGGTPSATPRTTPAPRTTAPTPGTTATTGSPPSAATSGRTDHTGGSAPSSGAPRRAAKPARPAPTPGAGRGAPTAPGGPGPAVPGTPAPSAGPAELYVSEPRREPDGRRWCERVSLTFANTGGRPVTEATVTLGTHVLGMLGTDWATVTTTRPLPAPLPPRQAVEYDWTVCVDAWRVPLGMRVETRDVSVEWK
ncbi:hypothetical protein BLA24_17305 [Streptomyces cinnamoneus]|uniref:Secreted protein n=1 Tax=Streptomyces cinnamoneus TaxID=53446 RepID=A0A2G1XH59_STRCJ|nr:hypothetical protein [Streptomyces cinnamoneus]PHQ50570.1 hypothetical protein BLA24_17305 [Streptomyces cinnamoneus]PPT14176.1 hypothetical protein CYQ11_15970 [Streptomyces cinnamoneus]